MEFNNIRLDVWEMKYQVVAIIPKLQHQLSLHIVTGIQNQTNRNCLSASLSLAVIVMDMLHIISSFREMIAMREGNVILQDKLKDVIIDLGLMDIHNPLEFNAINDLTTFVFAGVI